MMFSGSLVALITPMRADGSVDYDCLTTLAQWQIANGTTGLVVLGSTGESATLTERERERIITSVSEVVDQRVPVIVGTGASSTEQSCCWSQQAMDLGAQAVMVVTPPYVRPTQSGLLAHYQQLAQTVPLPMMLYNVPSRTGTDLLPETVAILAQHQNIVAIKEASTDVNRIDQLLSLDCGISVLAGNDEQAALAVFAGADGVVSVIANALPQLMAQWLRAAQRGDRVACQKIARRCRPAFEYLARGPNPVPIKMLLHAMGKIDKGIRLPLQFLSHVSMSAELIQLVEHQHEEVC